MARYTITPWKHPSDLLTVRQQFYRTDNGPEDNRRHAVNRIMAWKLRSNLPHAVESTALLIDAQLHHQNATSSTNNKHDLTISNFSLRAVYAAAFTRFVTGFCDIGRSREKRGLEQSSMLAIAKQIGMPVDFVALRHEATHEELPGLGRLVGAVEKGLEWLWGVYWGRLDSGDGLVVEGQEDRVKREVVGILRGFRRERRDGLRSGAARSGEKLIQGTVERCVEICRSKRKAAGLIAKVLVAERLLLPTNRTLGESMDGAYLIWDDMLQSLDRNIPSFSGNLIEALSISISKPSEMPPQNDTDKEAHALWLLHFAQTLAIAIDDRRDQVMQLCCLHPGHWSSFVGRRLLEDGEGLRETWQDIFDASILDGRLEDAGIDSVQAAGVDAMDVDGITDIGGGKWTRAAMPPSLPIGVVR